MILLCTVDTIGVSGVENVSSGNKKLDNVKNGGADICEHTSYHLLELQQNKVLRHKSNGDIVISLNQWNSIKKSLHS